MRVLAINDISCVGKCSLSVTLPILSACGVTCDILPTALLSTHTGGFEGYTFRDLTGDIDGILQHWKTLDIRFDIVYSGYLGNIKQIDLVKRIKNEFLTKNGLFIVDPVMGDEGRLYSGFNGEFVDEMRKLCQIADYILPNITEACLLTKTPYQNFDINAAFSLLQSICARPVVTGVVEDKKNSVFYSDNAQIKHYETDNIDGFFCGAGDVFASAFVGCLARGVDEENAIHLATDFTSRAIRRSAIEVPDKRYGLNFEKEIFAFLQKLNNFVSNA